MRPARAFAALIVAALTCCGALAYAGERALADVLQELRTRGLRIVFSSELVRPELRSPVPAAGMAAPEALAAALEPHGLAAVAGPGGTWLVVRAPAAARPVPVVSPPPPVFPVGVDLVTVDAVVLGAQGQPVAGMAADEFRVFEDGVAQTVLSFESIEAPAAPGAAAQAAVPPRPRASNGGGAVRPGRVFVIVFDEVHLSTERAERAKTVLEGFLRTQLREGDRVTILPTGGGTGWNGEMNASRRDLEAFLRHLKGLRTVDGSSCALNEYDALLFHRQRDPGIEARLMRWANECNPTLDPPVTPEARTDDRGRQLAPSLREARERRAELAIAPGRGQIQALAANIYDRANQRRKRTLEALARLLDGLAPLRGRKAVLLVSEGFILEPGLPEARRVAAASARANAPVYFIDARGTTGLDPLHSAESGTVLEGRDQGGFRDAQDHLADGAVSVAVETGGRAERGDLGAALERVARESTAYYLLGYHPTSDSRDPRFRKIRIETTRPGTSVLARPGYFPASAPADAASDSLDLRVRAGLDLAAAPAGVPTRLAAFVLGPAAAGKTRALLLAEADPRELGLQGRAATGLRGTLDTYALVVSRETGAVFPLMQRIEVDARIPEDAARDIGWLAVPREFELLPGTYQARFVVRGPGGRVGAVEHAFVVPPSGLRIATPVITDTAPLTDGRLALTARTLLRPSSGTLYCQFQVYGGTRDPATGEPRVSARYAIRHADGSPLAVGDAFEPLSPGADGAPARVFEIPLTGARSGSYRLTLEVRDQVSGQIRERQESFELALEPASQP